MGKTDRRGTLEIGQKIRALRGENNNMTQEALAERSGLSRSAIANLENGRYPSVTTETLARIAGGLGVPVHVLFGAEADPTGHGMAIDDFIVSDHARAMRVDRAELKWLRGVPASAWPRGVRAEDVAVLVWWYRSVSGRAQSQDDQVVT